MITLKKPISAHTDGKGMWSSERRSITIKRLGISSLFLNPDNTCIYFDLYLPKKQWDVNKYGIIYTDPAFLKDVRNYFKSLGFTKAALAELDYTEQGMQGDNYVSMEAGSAFIRSLLSRISL